ncbi:MAG TPA: LAGLIDADG family homing endonuclease [Candidatus Paceibacterota bacterium]|nr:LAGLIDADG family homing endonuclease [Candidatus Paceibacterota bacterium]
MLSPQYIVGLVDGEGSFTAYVRDPDKGGDVKRRVYVEPRFYIKLIERDRSILYQLKRYFGCGNVYFQRDARPNHQQCYRYEVFNWGDLRKTIIPFFRKHPLRLASRRRDFRIFCEIMERIERGEHGTRAGLKRLCRLKARMH